MSYVATSLQPFHKQHESKYRNTRVSIVLQPTMHFTGKGSLLPGALNGTAQLRASFKSQLTFYLHCFLPSALPKEILDLTTS